MHFLSVFLVILCMAGPAFAGEKKASKLSALDRLAIIELASKLDTAVDAKDWAKARSLFTETIEAGLPGVEPTEMASADLVGAWAANLYAEKTSFHLRGDGIIKADDNGNIRLYSKAYAWNRLPGMEGGEIWEVWGDYVYGVVREGGKWRISSFSFSPAFDRGNANIPGYQPE
ncbi:MAG: nuclear transport factor 2 family protein [Pseudomonadota bacterium]